MIEKSILHFHIKLSDQLKVLNERSKISSEENKKNQHMRGKKTLLRFCATANFMNETFFLYLNTNIDLL